MVFIRPIETAHWQQQNAYTWAIFIEREKMSIMLAVMSEHTMKINIRHITEIHSDSKKNECGGCDWKYDVFESPSSY